VVVAVIAVRMVEMAGDAIVHVVAVRHRLVATVGAVLMACLMPTAAMVRGAAVGILVRDLDHMLVDVTFVRVVEVAVVQIVDMVAVMHRSVSAARSVLMGMVGMGPCRTSRHRFVSFPPLEANTAVRPSAAWLIALQISGRKCS
jgi:hypothetical protein